MDSRKDLKNILLKGIDAVKAENIINNSVKVDGDILVVKNDRYNLDNYSKVYLLGSGKASIRMAKSLQQILGERIAGGLIISNYEESLGRVKVMKGSHPIPSSLSVDAAKALISLLKSFNETDFFIYLLSGGSSALMELPEDDFSIDEIQSVYNVLLSSGMDIDEINTIRKKLSKIKGGKLLNYTKSSGIVLVLSDVTGDKLPSIGSGPLYAEELKINISDIIEKYRLLSKLIPKVTDKLLSPSKAKIKHIPHYIIGNNVVALNACAEESRKLGYIPVILTSMLRGEAREVAKVILSIAEYSIKYKISKDNPICYLYGGETTVTIRGKGRGGRNQELCLSALINSECLNNIVLASVGTDGIDGNTDAAGAIIDKKTEEMFMKRALSPEQYLNNNDSYNFFKITKDLIVIGSTGTNVCDITAVIAKK